MLLKVNGHFAVLILLYCNNFLCHWPHLFFGRHIPFLANMMHYPFFSFSFFFSIFISNEYSSTWSINTGVPHDLVLSSLISSFPGEVTHTHGLNQHLYTDGSKVFIFHVDLFSKYQLCVSNGLPEISSTFQRHLRTKMSKIELINFLPKRISFFPHCLLSH